MGDDGSAGEYLDLYSLLRLHEGLRLRMYEDSKGNTTIGFGHNLENGITRAQAEAVLDLDVKAAEADLHARWPWTKRLDPVRHAVMVMLVFNMGSGVLSTFKTTLGLIETGYYIEASRQILKSLWAIQVGKEPGQRAWVLSEMLRSGEWPLA